MLGIQFNAGIFPFMLHVSILEFSSLCCEISVSVMHATVELSVMFNQSTIKLTTYTNSDQWFTIKKQQHENENKVRSIK